MKTRRSIASQMKAKEESEECPDDKDENKSDKSLHSVVMEKLDEKEVIKDDGTKKPKLLRRSNVSFLDKKTDNSDVSPVKLVDKIENSKVTPTKISTKKDFLKVTPIKLVEKIENSEIAAKKVVSPKKIAKITILDDSKDRDNFGCLDDLCLIDDDYDDFYQEVCSVVTTHNFDKSKKGSMEVKSNIAEVSTLTQKKRTQNKIVIFSDERIILDLSFFSKEVSVVAVYGLKLSNAIESIKTNSNFGKGTIFITVCGTHDLLTQVSLQECKNSKYCSKAVKIFEPSPATSDVQYLVKEACKLNTELLRSTENDIAIFCGLIPVDLNHENKFLRLNRECRLAHNVDQLPNADHVLLKNYNKAVECFNTFVTKHLEEIGVSPWNKDIFNSCSANLHQYKLFDSHFAICQVEQDKLQKDIIIKCNEVTQMLDLSSSAELAKKPVVQPSTLIVPEKINKIEKSTINHLEQLELLYHQDMQNIMKSHIDRVQSRIVIVTDDREILDVSLVGFDRRVEVLKIPGLSFDNAFGSIKNYKSFGNGTIFVFFCGIYDLLQAVSLEDCLNLKCKSPLKVFALLSSIEESKCLIKSALKLSSDILENSQNDIALFAGLIPVAINQYNKATFKNRQCVSKHPALPALNIHATKYNDYNSTIDWYNAFANYYAKTLGFSPWDLELSYFSHSKPLSLLLPNGYSLCYDEKMKRMNKVKILCKELMTNFPSEDELSKNQDTVDSSLKEMTVNSKPTSEVELKKAPIKIIIPSRTKDAMKIVTPIKPITSINPITPIKHITSIKTIPSIEPIKTLPKASAEVIKEKVCKVYSDEDLIKVKSFYQLNLKKILEMQKGRTQSSIVIVTDERDNLDVNLAAFNSRVTIMKIPGLKLANALTSIKINKNFGKGTIFIFLCGTHDLLLSVPLKECSELNCKSSQSIFNLSSSYSDSHSLIKKALKLNLNVLQSTKNDMVLYGGLIPVDIDCYNNKFCLLQRKCKSDHKALDVPNVDVDIYKAYMSAVKMFNDFTKYHAQTLNFAPWDLEVRCFLNDSLVMNKNLLLDGFNYGSEEEKERTMDVKYLCSKLFDSFAHASEDPILKIEEIEPVTQALDISIDSIKPAEEVKTITVKNEEIHVVKNDTCVTTPATTIDAKNVKKYSDSFLGRISSVYHTDMQKIMKLQIGRSPKNIVIYTDDRDHLDVNLAGFNRKVDIIKLPGMKLTSVFSLLKTHPGYGKGTVFIFLMGTHDLIKSVSLLDCLECQCPFRQTMLTLMPTSGDPHFLIKSALQLNLDILLTTTNDVALFCGLIPVRINVYNEFTIANRPCASLHPAFNVPNVDLFGYGNYRTSVLNYNNFTKYHAQSLGFEPWDLETPYFDKAKRNIMLPNMYNLRPDEEISRANQVRALCNELLRRSTAENKFKGNVSLTKETVPLVHKKEEAGIQGDETKMQTEDSKDVLASSINVPEHILKTLKMFYEDNVGKIVKLQMGRKQNNVVIVTDDRDNFDVHLRGFDHRVSVLREPGLKLGNAFPSLKKHHKFGKGTIFVFSCGSHDLLQSVSLNDCLLSMCPYPQTMLTLPAAEGDTQYLIKKALQVNIDILLATENDIALFCGVIPVRINHYNTYTVENRPCLLHHSAIQIPNVDLEKYTNYRETCTWFNNFTKYHAVKLSYKPWSLEQTFFCKDTQKTVLLPNCYNVSPVEEIRRANQAKVLCTELLNPNSSGSKESKPLLKCDRNIVEQNGEEKVVAITAIKSQGITASLTSATSKSAQVAVKKTVPVVSTTSSQAKTTIVASLTSKNKVNENLPPKVETKKALAAPIKPTQPEKKTTVAPSIMTTTTQAKPVAPVMQKAVNNLISNIESKLSNDAKNSERKTEEMEKIVKQDAIPKSNEMKYSDKRLENVKSIYFNNIQKITVLQKNRTPSNIVIVTDDRENLDVTLSSMNPAVEILKIPEAKFLSIFPIIKKHPKFGKGTIFIFSCGSHDLLVGSPLADCKKHRCQKPQFMFTLPSYISNFHYLIKKALELHMNILRSTKNDIALFCGILPVLINEFNKYNLNNRLCNKKHSAGQAPYIEHIHLSNYQFVLQWFNDFTKYHAQALGFSPWDLEVSYFENVNESKRFLPNGYNICNEEQLSRTNQIKLLCSELLGSITTSKEVIMPVVQTSQKVADESTIVPSEVVTILQKETSLHPKIKFNRVTIIADCRYMPYLEHLKKPEVLILADEQLEVDHLTGYFQKKKAQLTKKTLYLFVVGIHSVTQTVPFISCKNTCKTQLDALSALSKEDYKTQVIGLIKKFHSTIKVLIPMLPEESDFALLPPLPISLLNLNILHQKIHENKNRFPNYYIVSRTFLIHKLYQVWMDGMLTMSLSSLGQCTDAQGAMTKKFDDDYKKLKTMACTVNDKPNYNTWKEVAGVIVDSVLGNVGVSVAESLSISEAKINLATPVEKAKLIKSTVSCDYLVFIGHETSLKLLPEIDFCGHSKWSFSDVMERKNLLDMIKHLNELKFKKILFIVISDVDMIGVKRKNTECLINKCEIPLNYVMIQNAQCSIDKKIKDCIDSVKNIVSEIKTLVSCQSKVVIAPFTPITYILVSDLTKFHSKMHEHIKCDISSCFLKGNLRKYFDDILINFEKEWKKLILEIPHDREEDKTQFTNIESDYAAKNPCPIIWKNLTSEAFSHISSLLSDWKSCIVMFIKNGCLETSVTSSEKIAADIPTKVNLPLKSILVSAKLNLSLKNENISANSFMNRNNSNVPKVSDLSSKVIPASKPSTNLTQPKFSPRKENVVGKDANLKLGILNTGLMTTQIKQPENPSKYHQTTLPGILSSQKTIDFIQHVPNSIPLQIRALHPHIEQGKYDLSEAILNRDLDDVIHFARSVLSTAETVNISDSMFKNIFFVGKQKLIEPLLECSNLKSVMIDHDFSSLQDRDIQILLNKIRNFPEKSACCLVFDVSVVTTQLVKSMGCYQHSCKQPLYISALNTKSTNISQALGELDDLIYNKLQSITEFIVKLTRHVPVIVMPLVPTRIYCDLETSSNQTISNLNHQLTHSIYNLGACVVSGSPDLWSRVVQSLNLSWSILMDMNNRNYDILSCVSAYIGCKPNNFPILNKLSDFIVYWNELDIWKALIEAIVMTLVAENKHGVKGSNYPGLSKLVQVSVSNISPSIPYQFLEELFKSIDQSIFVVPPKENCTLKGVTLRNSFLVEKLNNCRVGDTMLCISVTNNSGCDRLELGLMENLFISSLYKKVYKKWKPQIVSNIAKEICEVPDVATLKSRPCEHGKNCRGPRICPWFHSFNDKRRNPFIHKYTDGSCMKARRGDGLCRDGVQCQSSHNMYEMKFHPVNYLISPCPSGKTSEFCNSAELCPHAHIDSPERLFIKEWLDLNVIGLHYSIKFFTGAIRAVIKVPNISRTNLRVLLISPSSEFLDVAAMASNELLKTFALNICVLGKNIGNPDSCQVLVGEPEAFVNADTKIFMNMRGAIIVDDIQQILANEKLKNNFLQFWMLINTRSYNIAVNKVFVSATFDPKSTSSVSELIGLQLKLLNVPEIDKSKDSITLQYVNKRKRDDATYSVLSGPNSPKRYRRSKSRTPPRFGRKRSRSRSLTRVEEASVGSSNTSFKRNKNLGLNTQNVANLGQSTFEQANISSNLSFNNKEQAKPTSSSKFDKNELRNLIGAKLYAQYTFELNAMLSAFEEDYAVYKDVPELHPNYENYFQTFADDYVRQHGDRDDQHKERMWKVHWKRIFEVTKQGDWRSKQHDLIEEYKGKVGNRIPPSNSTLTVFEVSLSVLESVCDKVPYLGQAVKAIIKTCRSFGTTTKEAFDVFTDSEAITLLNLTSEKLLAMGPSCFGNNRLFEQAINCIPKLLSEAKKGPQISSMPVRNLPIDIKAIARVSAGKGAAFALNLIRSALTYEGITNPPKEQVDDLFRKVCDLHI